MQAFREGLSEVPVHPDPDTIALSIADDTGSSVALRAIRDSGGVAVEVSDRDIVDALLFAARMGLSIEPASAASIAGAWTLAETGEIQSEETVVCCLTGAGPKWPEAISTLVEDAEVVSPGPEQLARLMS